MTVPGEPAVLRLPALQEQAGEGGTIDLVMIVMLMAALLVLFAALRFMNRLLRSEPQRTLQRPEDKASQ